MSSNYSQNFNSQFLCRICRCVSSSNNKLHSPCKCTGSVRYVHQNCLMDWLKYSKKNTCDLCSHRFNFKKLYSSEKPDYFPCSDIFIEIFFCFKRYFTKSIHYIVIILSWTFLIPLLTCRIYRSLNLFSLKPFFMIFSEFVTNFQSILIDCIIGICLSLTFIALFLAYGFINDIMNTDGIPPWLDRNNFNTHNFDRDINPEILFEENDEHNHILPINNEDDQIQDLINWENVLGLDGSIAFIEHIIWILVIKTIFILVFALVPYNIGRIFMLNTNLDELIHIDWRYEILEMTIGYLITTIITLSAHYLFKLTYFIKLSQFFGLAYLYFKVGIVYTFKVFLLPITTGIWIDLCTRRFSIDNSSKIMNRYRMNLMYIICVSWVKGIIFSFYVATMLEKLAQILRPGTLWFFKHFVNPFYQPIQMIIYSPIFVFLEFVCIDQVLTYLFVFFTFFLPSEIIHRFDKSFFPLKNFKRFSQPSDYINELILCQILLPLFISYIGENLFKTILKGYLIRVGNLLNLRSYILGDQQFKKGDLIVDEHGHLRESTNEKYQSENYPEDFDRHSFQSYIQPNKFKLRLILLICILVVTWVFIKTTLIYMPIRIGRLLQSDKGNWKNDSCNFILGSILITFFLFIASFIRHEKNLSNMISLTFAILSNTNYFDIFEKTLNIFSISIIIGAGIPIIIGYLIQLTFISPLLIPIKRSVHPTIYENWILGFSFIKLFVSVLDHIPECHLKHDVMNVFEEINQKKDNAKFCKIIQQLLPLFSMAMIFLNVPYLLSLHFPVNYFSNYDSPQLMRYGYIIQTLIISVYQSIKYLCITLEDIKIRLIDERYLIGEELVDFDEDKD